MCQIKKLKLNSFIIAFAFFQFGIFQLPSMFINSQIIIALSTIILFIVVFIINRYTIKTYVIFTFIFISSLFLVSYLLTTEIIALSIYIEFILKSFSLFLIGSYSYSSKYLYKYFKFLAIINLLSLSLLVAMGYIESLSYMRFGYALLPTLLVSLVMLLRNRLNLLWIISFLGSFILIFLYGSRGPFVSFIVLVIILIIIDKNISKFKKIIFNLIIALSYLFLVEFNLILKFLDYIYFDLGFNTYSILKFRSMLENGVLNASSGRDTLYYDVITQILENPIFGNGIGASEILWGYTTHNFVLQILLEFGIFGLIFSLIASIVFMKKFFILTRKDEYLFYVVIIILSSSIGRLLVSSDLWLRPEFWLGISLVLQPIKFDKNKLENTQ